MPSAFARAFISCTYRMRSATTKRTTVPMMSAIHFAVQGMVGPFNTGTSRRGQRRSADDFHILGRGEGEHLFFETGVRLERTKDKRGHIPVDVVQFDSPKEVGRRVDFDDDARVVGPAVPEG